MHVLSLSVNPFASEFERGDFVPRNLIVVPILFCLCSPICAQEWARKMFKTTDHDFGTVARSAKSDYAFEFQNIYKEKIHIAGIRASCGCITPTIENRSLDTWEKGEVHVKFNTHSFLGRRTATVTVTIDKPYFAEVQLAIKGLIRGDVVFDPGTVNFDSVGFGEEKERQVNVNYAGRSDWKIVDIRSSNTHLVVEPIETQRFNGRVGYELKVRLKPDTPVGYFNDEMILVTNDRQSQQIPLRVEGVVASPLTVSPAALSLGVLGPGQTVTKNIVVRSKKPFRITKVDCKDDCFEFVPSEEAKQLHLIPVRFTATDEPGKVSEQIQIETDLGAGFAGTVTATATVR